MGQIKKLWTEVIVITLSILVIFMYPVLLLLLVPLAIYRNVVKLIVSRDPKIGKMLSNLDVHFAAMTYSNKGNILIPFCPVTSRVDINHVITEFNEKVINFRDSKGNLKFRELKQRIVQKYGYMFWQDVDNFRIEEHIKCLNPENPHEPMRNTGFHDHLATLAKLPFDSSKSPWEIILVPNFTDDRDPSVKSLMLFRVHHSMCDGFAIFNMMNHTSVKPYKDLFAEYKYNIGFFTWMVYFIMILLFGPYHVLKMFYFSEDENRWAKLAKSGSQCSGRFVLNETDFIPRNHFKMVKKHFNVNISSVIIASTAEAIVRTMRKKNIDVSEFHMTLPWPLPGHPGLLTNHWTVVKMPIHINEPDPVATLKNVDMKLERLKYSVVPLACTYLAKLSGSLPVVFLPKSKSVVSSTCTLSNFPVSSESFDYFGYEVRYVNVGGAPSGFAIATACLGYNGYFKFGGGGDVSFLQQEDADFLIASFENVLQELQDAVRKKVK